MSDRETIEQVNADLQKAAAVFRTFSVSAEECVRAFDAFRKGMDEAVGPIDLRQVAKMRAGMMFDEYGPLVVLMPTFWRWVWMWADWRNEP